MFDWNNLPREGFWWMDQQDEKRLDLDVTSSVVDCLYVIGNAYWFGFLLTDDRHLLTGCHF
jgi:hypothetical protein